MSIVQLSHDLSTLSLGPVHRACRAASYGKVTVGKMPDSGPAEKLECFGGLSNKRENFQKRCPYPLCYLLCFFQSPLPVFSSDAKGTLRHWEEEFAKERSQGWMFEKPFSAYVAFCGFVFLLQESHTAVFATFLSYLWKRSIALRGRYPIIYCFSRGVIWPIKLTQDVPTLWESWQLAADGQYSFPDQGLLGVGDYMGWENALTGATISGASVSKHLHSSA